MQPLQWEHRPDGLRAPALVCAFKGWNDAADAASGPGFTPLVPAPRLARALGVGELWLKLDTANPTHSFKDRVVAVAAAKAQEFGFETLSCTSTGNLAGAVADYRVRCDPELLQLVGECDLNGEVGGLRDLCFGHAGTGFVGAEFVDQ